MAHCYCTTIFVNARIIICNAKMIQERKNLYCECFINFK